MKLNIPVAPDTIAQVGSTVLPSDQKLTVEYEVRKQVYTFCIVSEVIETVEFISTAVKFHSDAASRAKAKGLKEVLKRISVASEEVEADGKTYLMVEL